MTPTKAEPATRLVVLLRGINVGGRNKLAMATLREVCASLGCTDVSTYIQSGNVVLDTSLTPKELSSRLEEALETSVGFRPPVVVRSHDDLTRVLDANPYPDANEGFLHVGFLSALPAEAAVTEVGEVDCEPERFAVIGCEVYLDYVEGAGRSKKLAKVPFERRLGVRITARNLRTVKRLAELSAP